MFNHVQQDIIQPIELFKQVLTSNAQLTDAQVSQLQILLGRFPQMGLLHAIQARTGNAEQVTEAAAWFGDSALLQMVVQAPDKLPLVNKAHIIVHLTKPNLETEYKAPHFTPVPEEDTFYEVTEEEAEEINLKDGSDYIRPIFKEEPFDETQKLIVENIASNDYFVFDKAFSDRNQMGETIDTIKPEIVEEPAIPAPLLAPTSQDTPEVVTRYHDDKMPYSFMWWLDKTRNKHSGVYQPFTSDTSSKSAVQPEAETFVNNTLDNKAKEDNIIERFIQDEPQMRTPSGDKLDSENKAKQSAQDHEELITETLARIYADQMLFSKAIAAYKILILKNPEKRRYFASQIENLEKKIN